MITNTITAGTSPEATYGLFFYEGNILRAARAGSLNFFQDANSRKSLYYFSTSETDDYVGRITGVLVKGSGGYYVEVQRPKPAVGFIPGTWVPNFVTETGYIFVGTSVNYFYDNFSIDGRNIPNNSVIVDTTATSNGTGGQVVITKTNVPTEREPVTTNTPQPQPKGPMYALIGLLALAGIGILYLSFKKPTKK